MATQKEGVVRKTNNVKRETKPATEKPAYTPKKKFVKKNKPMHGYVKWFDIKKGYGFIMGDDGNEYFLHYTGIENGKHYTGLDPEDEVEFSLVPDRQGRPQATAVNMIIPLEGSGEDSQIQPENTVAPSTDSDECETVYVDPEGVDSSEE